MIEPSLNLLSSELLIEGMTILFDKREQNSPYPPSYRYMRHLPPTPDKGEFVIFVIGRAESGTNVRNYTFQKYHFNIVTKKEPRILNWS